MRCQGAHFEPGATHLVVSVDYYAKRLLLRLGTSRRYRPNLAIPRPLQCLVVSVDYYAKRLLWRLGRTAGTFCPKRIG